MKFFSRFLIGILIGIGYILPGISSGVLCVIFGIYNLLLDSVLNFFRDIKKNFIFLCPITLGAGVGIIIFSRLLQYLLSKFAMQTKAVFIGLILGGVILLLKQIIKQNGWKKQNFIYLFSTFLIGIVMVYLENKLQIKSLESVSFLYLLLSGFLMSIGIVVPGVSSTIILMLLGTYSYYLSAISNLYFPVLIPMCIGIFIGCLLFIKIIKKLLEKYYEKTMFSIIGFSIGSVFVLLPTILSIYDFWICMLCFICGYLLMNVIKSGQF